MSECERVHSKSARTGVHFRQCICCGSGSVGIGARSAFGQNAESRSVSRLRNYRKEQWIKFSENVGLIGDQLLERPHRSTQCYYSRYHGKCTVEKNHNCE
ncbi:hypothetical protein Y032_0025g1166 [Ancylostoma ceylanicum]|uniref:Uncharacterized protein n=1 Tax=Ancylostoma ceylanicum TaxID=53326 RepID=A0A016UVA6_9BILA|nr:hypothetical protein Y032_0025g1166 [Ancylostoma ceylanicum]